MAVSSPAIPDLAGSYANIQSALQTGVKLASQNQGGLGAAAAIAQPLGDEAQKQRDELFKYGLQDNLEKNKVSYQAQAEGKTLRTQDDAVNLATKYGVDPEKVKDLVPKEGIWTSPDQENDLLNKLSRSQTTETMAQQFEAQGSKQKANLVRLLGRSNDPQADQWLARLSGVSKPILKVDPATKTLHAYDEMSGQDLGVVPGSNTPDSASGVHVFDDIPSLQKVDGTQAQALKEAAKSASSDPSLKATAKDLDDLAQLKKLLASNNPSAVINVRADLARDIGGVPGGRFSSVLASTEGTDPSISARLGNYMSMKTTGQMSDKIKQELADQITTTEISRRAQLAQTLDEKHKTVKGQAPYASDDLIASQLGYQRYLSSPETAATSAAPARQAFTSANDVVAAFKSGQLDRATAKKILQDRGWAK